VPHNKSCKKRMKTSALRRLSNRDNRTAMRSVIKNFRTVAASEDKSPEMLSTVYRMLDTQARKGVIPKSRASRLKSRMAALYAK